MLYYFDETADQGFVDKTTSLSEYGILAGISFPEHAKNSLEALIEEIAETYINFDYKKLHCHYCPTKYCSKLKKV